MVKGLWVSGQALVTVLLFWIFTLRSCPDEGHLASEDGQMDSSVNVLSAQVSKLSMQPGNEDALFAH